MHKIITTLFLSLTMFALPACDMNQAKQTIESNLKAQGQIAPLPANLQRCCPHCLTW